MSEQKIETIVQIQAKTKPKIEEMIPQYLEGEAKQSMINFLEICKANGVKTKWSATNRWSLRLDKQGIGMIYMGVKPCGDAKKGIQKNAWYTYINSASELIHRELDKEGISEKEKENITHVVHRNLKTCANDKKRCAPLKNITILGKEFNETDNLCSDCGKDYYQIMFSNPDERTLYWLNKVLEIDRKARE